MIEGVRETIRYLAGAINLRRVGIEHRPYVLSRVRQLNSPPDSS